MTRIKVFALPGLDMAFIRRLLGRPVRYEEVEKVAFRMSIGGSEDYEVRAAHVIELELEEALSGFGKTGVFISKMDWVDAAGEEHSMFRLDSLMNYVGELENFVRSAPAPPKPTNRIFARGHIRLLEYEGQLDEYGDE